jgi:hypothetical protein
MVARVGDSLATGVAIKKTKAKVSAGSTQRALVRASGQFSGSPPLQNFRRSGPLDKKPLSHSGRLTSRVIVGQPELVQKKRRVAETYHFINVAAWQSICLELFQLLAPLVLLNVTQFMSSRSTNTLILRGGNETRHIGRLHAYMAGIHNLTGGK